MATAQTARTWNGPTTGDWFTAVNWTPSDKYPQPGDSVTVTNGSILLTNETAHLASFTITNSATLTFSNWIACLRATEINICANGTVGHAAVNTNAAPGITNRVYLFGSNVTVHSGGKIDVSYQGFRRGVSGQFGQGPGGGMNYPNTGHGGPAGHGGQGGGGGNTPGGVYGSIINPETPGSGGGAAAGTAGHGGGVVRINATGTVRIEGDIFANAANGSGDWTGGPGAGGSIWISCQTFRGGGRLQAIGGNGDTSGSWMAGGGGGRISVIYNDMTAQAALNPRPTARISVMGGGGSGSRQNGTMGTIYYPDVSIFAPFVYMAGYLHFVTNDITIPHSLTASNVTFGFPAGDTVRVSGDFVLTNGSSLTLIAAPTNGTAFGAFLAVAGSLVVASNSTLYPQSDTTNGGSIKMTMTDLTVLLGGKIQASLLGYQGAVGAGNGWGPGAGKTSGGYGGPAGHGGMGGGLYYGGTYDSSNYPTQPGSGGGAGADTAGSGGGVVWVDAEKAILIDGSVLANGGDGTGEWRAGPGSGGSINFDCQAFHGRGVLQANGGNGPSVTYMGGAGGGRIAVWIDVPVGTRASFTNGVPGRVIQSTEPPTNNYPGAVFFTGSISVTNGSGRLPAAGPGTCLFFTLPRQ